MRQPTRPPKLEEGFLHRLVNNALDTGHLIVSRPARQRGAEREISLQDVRHGLRNGHHVAQRDRFHEPTQEWSYCFHGPSVDGGLLRIVVVLQDWMLVVTVIRPGSED
jgi:hypothetical protein